MWVEEYKVEKGLPCWDAVAFWVVVRKYMLAFFWYTACGNYLKSAYIFIILLMLNWINDLWNYVRSEPKAVELQMHEWISMRKKLKRVREKKKMIPERKKEHWALLERLRGLLFAWQGPLSAWLLRRRFLYRSPTTMMFLQRMTSLLLTISSSLASRLSLSLQQFTRLLFLKSNTLADEAKNGLQSLQNTFWACGLNITILNGLSDVFFFFFGNNYTKKKS